MPIFLMEDRGLEVVRTHSRSHGGHMEKVELEPRPPDSKPTQLTISRKCLLSIFTLSNPVVGSASPLHQPSHCWFNRTVFQGVFPKSPAGFPADEGATWGGSRRQVLPAPRPETRGERLFALGGVMAPAMVPSLQLRPKSELTPSSVSLAWRRPRPRVASGRG